VWRKKKRNAKKPRRLQRSENSKFRLRGEAQPGRLPGDYPFADDQWKIAVELDFPDSREMPKK